MHSIAAGCDWVHLVSVVSEDEFADARATGPGNVVFENVKPGAYMFILLGHRGICSVNRVNIGTERVQDLAIQ
jgi:hypothetical protein